MPDRIKENLSEEEARKEVESINAEIAKAKGIDLEEKNEPEKKTSEPADQEEPKEESEDDLDQDDEEDVDPTKRTGNDQRMSVSRHLAQKAKIEAKAAEAEAEKETLAAKVKELTDELSKLKTSQAVGSKIKEFSEKHGMDEAAATDLVQIVMEQVKPADRSAQDDRLARLLQKQDAEDAFAGELSSLFQTEPDAADHVAKIRAEAYKKENINLSLYEVYNRFVKPTITEKRKGGEVSRGTSRQNASKSFDPADVAKRIEGGEAGLLKTLTAEEQDKLFTYMEKTGSRYINKN